MARKDFKAAIQDLDIQATVMDGQPAILISYATADGPKTLCQHFGTKSERDRMLPLIDQKAFEIINGLVQ